MDEVGDAFDALVDPVADIARWDTRPSTPVAAISDQVAVISDETARPTVRGLDPTTGEEMWSFESPVGLLTRIDVVATDDHVFIMGGEGAVVALVLSLALYRFTALVISGTLSGLSGALYCLLFGYVGSSFASLQYSTLPLLWTLLGGTGVTLGPPLGAAITHYLIDISSGLTSSYMIIVGVALVAITLWFPEGLAGWFRRKRRVPS